MLVRRLSIGFIAGACSLVGVLLILLLVLLGGNLVNLLYQLSINQTIQIHGDITFWSALGQAFAQSLQALPGFFWSTRWGMMALGALGIALAGVDVLRKRIDRPWRDSLGFIVTIGVVGAVVIASQYINREALQAYLAGQPGMVDQGAFLVSDPTLLMTGLLITLGLGYVVWVAWHWWFERWARWLGLPRPVRVTEVAPATTTVPGDDWRTYQERMMRLKRNETETTTAPAATVTVRPRSPIWTLGLALLVMTLLVYGGLRLYHAYGSNLITGQTWLSTDSPGSAIPISFRGVPQEINISNINGTGSVDAYLTNESTGNLQRSVTLQLPGVTNTFVTAQIDVDGLAPGAYQVNIALQNGQGGSIMYAVLDGGGVRARIAALVLGLAAGLWIALAFVLGYELLAARTSRL